MKRKKTKVVYKDLKKYWGWADVDKNVIELSKNMTGRRHLDIILHESIHLMLPSLDEDFVKEKAKWLRDILWEDGYRKQTPQE